MGWVPPKLIPLPPGATKADRATAYQRAIKEIDSATPWHPFRWLLRHLKGQNR